MSSAEEEDPRVLIPELLKLFYSLGTHADVVGRHATVCT